ncbi:MAG: glycine cleavage system protein GcvH [Gammaproteobacteria bacterium]|nr:MAG: glycine cleavage system protein GcvH [Gammaproteobacteria bacterium]RKZ96195.1 MAG: glycine cleavage system protein GcvH [Gammaproteobacteria bacterium]RKZ96902.1 MAG: glycine cleavage system protein GcvH [Gammaproteobacteria bacterium]HHA18532.1 glycine cleavage system protein GcvH [Methylophaga sp.]
MSNPNSLKYAESHEWVRVEDTGELTVGITDHAQDLLGDLVYAELPEVGQRFSAKEECMLLESVKAASDIYMPVNGEIAAVNSALEDSPELINEDSFGEGWLFKIQPDNKSDIESMLSAEAYETSLDA